MRRQCKCAYMYPPRDHSPLRIFPRTPFHGVRLSRGCLPVRKDRSVVTEQELIHDGEGDLVEHILLGRTLLEHLVKRELVLRSGTLGEQGISLVPSFQTNAIGGRFKSFAPLVSGPYPGVYLNS